MRLLLTTDAVGGIWTYAIDLAAALSERGVSVVLAIMGPAPSADKRATLNALVGVTVIETGLALDWLCDGPAAVRSAGHRLAELALAHRVDLVHLHTPTLAAGVVYPVPVVVVAHGCVSTWWAAARKTPLDPAFWWHHALMAEGLNAADAVIAPSLAYATTVARHYALQRVPLVVHNGRAVPHRSEARSCHDAVITVGRLWDAVKQAALLDRVASRVAVPFFAVGATTGPHGEAIELDNLIDLGEVGAEGVARRLASQPVFVSAATFEPFGLAVLEAAGAGCALVLADIATFRELWDGAAIFVPPDDEARFGDAIDTLIGDATLRRQLGVAARARASRYTPGPMVEAMLRHYADLGISPVKRVAA